MNHQDLVNISVHVVRHLGSSCAPRGCISNTDYVSPHYSGWCRPHRKVNGGFSLDSDIFCLFKTFYSQKFILGAKQASPRPCSWMAFVSWRCTSALASFAFCSPGSWLVGARVPPVLGKFPRAEPRLYWELPTWADQLLFQSAALPVSEPKETWKRWRCGD